MRLNHSPTSPYVRKVMACAVARGLDGRLDLDATNPHPSASISNKSDFARMKSPTREYRFHHAASRRVAVPSLYRTTSRRMTEIAVNTFPPKNIGDGSQLT